MLALGATWIRIEVAKWVVSYNCLSTSPSCIESLRGGLEVKERRQRHQATHFTAYKLPQLLLVHLPDPHIKDKVVGDACIELLSVDSIKGRLGTGKGIVDRFAGSKTLEEEWHGSHGLLSELEFAFVLQWVGVSVALPGWE